MIDLIEVKKMLEIFPDNTYEDVKINLLIDIAQEWIEEILNRRIFLSNVTEFYNGTGTQRLLLRRRPVFPAPAAPNNTLTVWVDDYGLYGTSPMAFSGPPLVYGVDYTLQIDQDDGSSRCGILIRTQDYWPKPVYRQAGLLSPFVANEGVGEIKVQYFGGLSIDTLPAQVRAACLFLVSSLRYVLPVGMELSADSYEGRSISIIGERKDYLMAIVKPMIFSHRNWKW